MKAIGDIFRERREALRLKQEEVVRAVGLPGGNATLSILERGRMPRFDVACKIAYALQISPNELASMLGIKVRSETQSVKGVVTVRQLQG